MRTRTPYSVAEVVLAFVGTTIACIVYYAHANNITLPCTSGGGCELADSSHWAEIGPLPLVGRLHVSLLGAAGYALLALLGVVKLTADAPKLARSAWAAMLLLAAGGAVYSWYLQYVDIVFIGPICMWCRASAVTMTLLLLALVAEGVMARAAGAPSAAGGRAAAEPAPQPAMRA